MKRKRDAGPSPSPAASRTSRMGRARPKSVRLYSVLGTTGWARRAGRPLQLTELLGQHLVGGRGMRRCSSW